MVDAQGYSRPISAGDRRQRSVSAFIPAWRVASWDPVGKIRVEYECPRCNLIVIPGVTHIRNWNAPDYWVPMQQAYLWRPKQRRYRERRRRRREGHD